MYTAPGRRNVNGVTLVSDFKNKYQDAPTVLAKQVGTRYPSMCSGTGENIPGF